MASSRRFPNERPRRTVGIEGTAAAAGASGTRSRCPRSPAERALGGGAVREAGCLGSACSLLFIAALGLGVWRHYQQHRQVMDTAEQQANFVPTVRVEEVTQRLGRAARDIARDDARLRGSKHLCARQRLCAEALCRYRRSRQGRAAPRRDHCTRSRGPGRPISEQSAAGSGDDTPKRSPARVDTGHQHAIPPSSPRRAGRRRSRATSIGIAFRPSSTRRRRLSTMPRRWSSS